MSELTTTLQAVHRGRAKGVWPIQLIADPSVELSTQLTISADYCLPAFLDALKKIVPPNLYASTLNESALIKIFVALGLETIGVHIHPVDPVLKDAREVFASFGIKI
jgi:hypothetical protein